MERSYVSGESNRRCDVGTCIVTVVDTRAYDVIQATAGESIGAQQGGVEGSPEMTWQSAVT